MAFRNQQGLSDGLPRYKGNLHSHTVNSDGCLTPQESAEAFREHGYHFLCFSEHDLYTDYSGEFDREDFIILPGLEASALLVDESGTGRVKTHHMHGILGTDEMVEKASRRFEHMERLEPLAYVGSWDGASVCQSLADTLRDHGCIVTYNHPVWSRVDACEFEDVEGFFGLEVFNYNTVNESGTGYDVTCWDRMLRSGKRVWGLATDDNHNEGLFDDAFGGWIVVCAPELSRNALVAAMLEGSYYSSSGPEIVGWGVEDGVVWVECSPCERVNMVAGGFVGAGETRIAEGPEGIRRAEFALRGDETYVRVECVDAAGKTAWSNPLFA